METVSQKAGSCLSLDLQLSAFLRDYYPGDGQLESAKLFR